MAVIVSDVECQLLYLTAGVDHSNGFATVQTTCAELNLPICLCKAEIIDTTCREKIASELYPHSGKETKSRLLIAGQYLEDQVNVCALHGLYLGYEVFLLKDFTVAQNQNHAAVFDSRLIQAGVVLTTFRQLLYEWVSNEKVVERREKMLRHLSDVDLRTRSPR